MIHIVKTGNHATLVELCKGTPLADLTEFDGYHGHLDYHSANTAFKDEPVGRFDKYLNYYKGRDGKLTRSLWVRIPTTMKTRWENEWGEVTP